MLSDPVPFPNTFSSVLGGADVPFADVAAPNVLQGGADGHPLTADDITLLLESIVNPASPTRASIPVMRTETIMHTPVF